MPSISLDNQVFFDLNQLKIPKIQHQNPDVMCENARVPQPQPATPSNDDAIVISSDDESDDEDSASVRSSSSLPSVDQLLADMRDCGNLGIDERKKSHDTSNLGACDGHPTQDIMMDGPELRSPSPLSPDNEDCDMPQSSASPCSLLVAEPILLPSTTHESSVPVQSARQLPDPIALCSQTLPDTTTCPSETDTPNESTENISRDIMIACGKSRFSSKYTRHFRMHETNSSQSAGPCDVSACEGGDDEDGSQAHPVKSRLRRRKVPVRYASCSTATSETDSADEDQHRHKRRKTAAHAQKAAQDDSYDPPDSDQDQDQDQAPQPPVYNGFCGLSSVNETETDEDDGSINKQPSETSRRRKAMRSPSSTVPRRSTRKKMQSTSGNFSRQSSLAAGRYGMPSPPHTYTSDDESHIETPTAKFEEWPLGQAVLKRITIDGSVTFQLQFTWEPCDKNQRNAPGGSHKNPLPRTKSVAKQSVSTKSYSAEEDSLLIALKDQGLSWNDIQVEHGKQFPERAKGSLQVRYCTKLKRR
ncbi:hypothetical protein HJFPF1_12413 [Paramyrothecium foliicola]|nr:hypothetical protein HJFPF1_12413 [Paramyrothecium foliicola]